MLYPTFQLLQQSEKLRGESQVLLEKSKLIKARSATLLAPSKQVSAAIAAADAEVMQHGFFHAHALYLNLFERI